MNSFIESLAGKLADRWLALVAGPGLTLVAAVFVAMFMRWHRADAGRLRHLRDEITTSTSWRPGSVLLVLGSILTLGVAASILIRAIGGVTEQIWMAEYRLSDNFSRGIEKRRQKWEDAQLAVRTTRAAYRAAVESGAPVERQRELAELLRRHLVRRDGLGLASAPPCRPTWMADRMTGVALRVRAEFGVDLASVWPRLWLVLPENARNDVTTALQSFRSATRTAGWGFLVTLVGVVLWWPDAAAGVVVSLIGWRNGRAAVRELANVVEACVDVYSGSLGQTLGVTDGTHPMDRQAGLRITSIARKEA